MMWTIKIRVGSLAGLYVAKSHLISEVKFTRLLNQSRMFPNYLEAETWAIKHLNDSADVILVCDRQPTA